MTCQGAHSIISLDILSALQEGGPLPGPETGFLSNTWKWIIRGDIRADKARDYFGKGRPGGEQEGKGTQENSSVTWLAALGFMVMGLVSGLSLANYSDSESFLVVHALFSQDGCQREGFWEVVGHVVSPFDLSRTLPVQFSSVQLFSHVRHLCDPMNHSTAGFPVHHCCLYSMKQICHMVPSLC